MKTRSFRGPWISQGATTPAHEADVVVSGSKYSPHDIYVAAGCQAGHLHVTTAIQLAENIVEAVLELAPTIMAGYLCEATNRLSRTTHKLGYIDIITVSNHRWYAFWKDRLITGPHTTEGWSFRFTKDPSVERVITLMDRLKGGETPEQPQAAEPDSAS